MGNLQGNPYEQNLGDTDGGMATLRKASAISDRLLKEHPSDREAIHANALVRGSIGDLLFGSGKPKEAIENETAAARALEKLASEPGASAVAITEASVAYETLGDEYGQIGVASLGDPKAALANYNKSLELNARAIAADPSYSRPRRGRAVLQMKIGSIQVDTNPEQALATFLSALKTFDALPEREKTSFGSRRIKANLLRKTGIAYEAIEEWDSALSYYNQALRTEEAFAAVDPDDSRQQYNLAIVLNNVGLAEEGKGDREAALETSRRVESLLQVLIRRDPQNPVWRGHLADLEERMSDLLAQKGAKSEGARLRAKADTTARELASRPGATVLDLCRAGRMLKDVAFAEKCAEFGGQNPDSLRVLAKAYRGAGRLEDARRVARQGLAMLALTRPTFLRRELEEAAR
jgi:tetratricopeptide (TPR) repeat protein